MMRSKAGSGSSSFLRHHHHTSAPREAERQAHAQTREMVQPHAHPSDMRYHLPATHMLQASRTLKSISVMPLYRARSCSMTTLEMSTLETFAYPASYSRAPSVELPHPAGAWHEVRRRVSYVLPPNLLPAANDCAAAGPHRG